jgi:uncharacterized delta-60 repeat protein
LAAALVLGVVSSVAQAAPGELDSSFGSSGKVTTMLGIGGSNAGAMLALPDDRLLVAGHGVTGFTPSPFSINIDFALVRYEPNGALDPSFGTGGIVLTEFAGGIDQAWALVRQPDGKVVAAGFASPTADATGDTTFALARYNADGSLDATFGVGGKVTTDLTPFADWIYGAAVDSAGRIVVAGVAGLISFGGGSSDFALARYTPNGTLDATFGNGGVQILDFGGSLSSEDIAFALAIQPDGRIVAAGTAGRDTAGSFHQRSFGLARLQPDGALDPTFGVGGLVTTTFTFENSEVLGLALTGDGRIVAAGSKGSGPPRWGSGRDFALARYLPNGSLDPAFGADGTTSSDFAGGGDEAADIVLQTDGKIVAAGVAQVPDPSTGGASEQFALARYDSTGALDSGFGDGGKVTTTYGAYSRIEAVALQSDGRIVGAGTAFLNGEHLSLARYLATEATAAEQLAALALAVVGVGPGTSLADKVRKAQTSLAAGNESGACTTLGAFIREVGAQSGKSIPEPMATSLVSDANRIRTTLGC